MKKEETLEEILIAAVKEALADKHRGRVVRSKLDVADLRKSLCMSQRKFAEAYRIHLETLKNWEQGKRFSDTTSCH